ncbi:DUF4917 family protein [Brevibacterium linens]|uniref:DUF4917 family protein n=1 Tax=Brevibacterium linens TaxID=1703 RepID=UPI000FCB0A55|nr:DUF4917 family protein [Brevibacterium linens]AZU01167.1 DUF4917 domain-containing protein [Brevibacterium linens]
MSIIDYDRAMRWVQDAPGGSGPHLLLGNGFSMAYNAKQFSYGALKSRASERSEIGEIAEGVFRRNDTSDFESVIKELESTASVLEVVNSDSNGGLIDQLLAEAQALKETLARAIVDLHPDVHYEIEESASDRVSNFLDNFKRIYTTNYDILLYWVLMRNLDFEDNSEYRRDDGFRGAMPEDPFVVWDNLNSSRNQTVYYLHGALHLFMNEARGELQKVTWIRTSELLLDQIRGRLEENSFPLIITEGTAENKRSRIMQSDYLGTTLRSFANIGGGLLVYGLAFSESDDHLKDAIVNSNIQHLAVSVFGDPDSENNIILRNSVNKMVLRRQALIESRKRRSPLAAKFFHAESVDLW